MMVIAIAFISICIGIFTIMGSAIALSQVDMRTKNKILRIIGYYILVPLFAGGVPVPMCFFLIPTFVFEATLLQSFISGFVYVAFIIVVTKIVFYFSPALYKDLTDPNRTCMLDYTFTGCMLRGDKDYINKFYFPNEKYIEEHPITNKDLEHFPYLY